MPACLLSSPPQSPHSVSLGLETGNPFHLDGKPLLRNNYFVVVSALMELKVGKACISGGLDHSNSLRSGSAASPSLIALQIDIDDVAAINPELVQLLPLRPKDSLPLQENITIPVSACHRIAAAVPEELLSLVPFC